MAGRTCKPCWGAYVTRGEGWVGKGYAHISICKVKATVTGIRGQTSLAEEVKHKRIKGLSCTDTLRGYETAYNGNLGADRFSDYARGCGNK